MGKAEDKRAEHAVMEPVNVFAVNCLEYITNLQAALRRGLPGRASWHKRVHDKSTMHVHAENDTNAAL